MNLYNDENCNNVDDQPPPSPNVAGKKTKKIKPAPINQSVSSLADKYKAAYFKLYNNQQKFYKDEITEYLKNKIANNAAFERYYSDFAKQVIEQAESELPF